MNIKLLSITKVFVRFFCLYLLVVVSTKGNYSYADPTLNLTKSTIRIKACIHELDHLLIYGSKLIWRTNNTNSQLSFRPGEGNDCFWFDKGIKISIDGSDFTELPLDDTHWTKYESTPEPRNPDPYFWKKMAYWVGEFDLSEEPYYLSAENNPKNRIISVNKEAGRGELILEEPYELWVWDSDSGSDYYDFIFVYEYENDKNIAQTSF